MSAQDMNTIMTNREMTFATLALPFKAFWNGMISLAENSSRMRQLSALADTSDEELAAKGMTRGDAVQRIINTYF